MLDEVRSRMSRRRRMRSPLLLHSWRAGCGPHHSCCCRLLLQKKIP